MQKVLRGTAIAASLFCLAGAAQASLSITNGDFEAGGGGGGGHVDDVIDWFDNSNGIFWQGTWVTNDANVTPNGTNVVVLGSNNGTGTNLNTMSPDPMVGNYAYQSIGTSNGGPTLQVNFDWGTPNDDTGGRELGLMVAVYAYDGLGGFTADNNTDVHGASGVTLLDSQSFEQTSTGVDGLIAAALATLDISGAGSQELFLRFNSYRPANTEAWPVIDNVSVTEVPEPASLALMGLGGLMMLRRRRG